MNRFVSKRGWVLFGVMALSLPSDAQAYIDGGTASIVFQGVAAAVFGISFAVKLYWRRAFAWLRRAKPEAGAAGAYAEASETGGPSQP